MSTLHIATHRLLSEAREVPGPRGLGPLDGPADWSASFQRSRPYRTAETRLGLRGYSWRGRERTTQDSIEPTIPRPAPPSCHHIYPTHTAQAPTLQLCLLLDFIVSPALDPQHGADSLVDQGTFPAKGQSGTPSFSRGCQIPQAGGPMPRDVVFLQGLAFGLGYK